MVCIRKVVILVSAACNSCNTVKGVLRYVNYYFFNARSEIAEKNLNTLKIISVSTFFIGVFLGSVAPYLIPDWIPTRHYWQMVPTLVVFILFSFIYKKKANHSYFVVQTACVLFCVMLLYHFIDISVFSHPDMPDTFVSMFIMMIPVMFIIHPAICSGLMIGGGAVFWGLLNRYKTGIAVSHDSFAIIATFFFAVIIMLVVFDLRINDFFLRERYILRSRMDQLTGLLNKRSYERSCQQALRTKPYDASCALIIFDIDDFKVINDRRGHLVGDRALEIIGEVLTETFRTSDYVGRIGGDEFSAFVLPGSDNICLCSMAQRVLDEVARRTNAEIGQEVTLSVGIVWRKRGNAYYEKFFVAADSLLYNAKCPDCSSIQIKML